MKQLCNVVMLPTNKASKLVLSFKEKSFNHLTEPKLTLLNEETSCQLSNIQSQHLYIISSENPSVQGDWMFYGNRYSIKELHQFQKGIDSAAFLKEQGIRKVIATTNKNITSLAQIPESFIKKFVESNGSITEVSVDFVDVGSIINDGFGGVKHISDIQPKLREDNTIIISPSKTFTQQEMINLFNKFTNQYSANISIMYLQDEFPKWIEKNL